MKVEVWSDVTCPWCGIGFYRLRRAISEFEHGAEVEVVHRSFELVPHAQGTWTVQAHMANRYGLSPEQIDANIAKLEATAAEEGIAPYRLRENVMGNTSLAHQFLAFARSKGVGGDAWAAVFERYFGQAESVFDVDSLVGLAPGLGLDPEHARRVLAEGRFEFNVANDVHALRARGVEGVPYHVFAGRYVLPGTDRVDVLLNALTLAWDHHETETIVLSGGQTCSPEGCCP
ncbi:MAG: DsbA family oxidoreductase [Sporichthyaceae bacterium]